MQRFFARYTFLLLFILLFTISNSLFAQPGIVVVQTDFGLKDGAVSAAKGVIYSVDRELVVSDLTHEIPAFHIWDAAYRLYQTAPYWPKGTVFVSVVDPGVGTSRRSIVARTNNDQYFVTPDNGTLTLIKDTLGIAEVRVIDESKHRLQNSNHSYTFYGRDVYAYTAAKLAAGKISFAEVGPLLTDPIVTLSYQPATLKSHSLYGTIVILDPQYGNIWTNIDKKIVDELGIQFGKNYQVKVFHGQTLVYSGILPLRHTFGEVKKGSPLLYMNSLMNLAIGINQGDFAKVHQVGYGSEWTITISKINP